MAVKILCVDDDPEMLTALSELLGQTLKAEVHIARSVPEAISAMRESGPYDVLVTDYQLSPYTALDLVHHLS